MLPPLAVGTFISVGKTLDRAIERVQTAERLGYESAYVTHIAARDSMTVCAAYACRTERIRVGTGVLPIYSRTPVATAQIAATVDELSGGRFTLGIGVSHRPVVEPWYGQKIEKPAREMRDYASALRAIFRNEDPPTEGRFPTQFHFMGYEVRPDLPIYLAALSPAMLRLAGEIGDGVILWLCTPDYIRDVVVPEVRTGRERAGKGLEGFDVVAAVPSAVTDSVDEPRAILRADLIPYFSLPFYRAMLERSGFGDDIKGFDEGMSKGDAEAATAAISDRFLESLAAIGDPDTAAATVRHYLEAGATSPCLGAIPRTDFDRTLEALSDLTG